MLHFCFSSGLRRRWQVHKWQEDQKDITDVLCIVESQTTQHTFSYTPSPTEQYKQPEFKQNLGSGFTPTAAARAARAATHCVSRSPPFGPAPVEPAAGGFMPSCNLTSACRQSPFHASGPWSNRGRTCAMLGSEQRPRVCRGKTDRRGRYTRLSSAFHPRSGWNPSGRFCGCGSVAARRSPKVPVRKRCLHLCTAVVQNRQVSLQLVKIFLTWERSLFWAWTTCQTLSCTLVFEVGFCAKGLEVICQKHNVGNSISSQLG